MICPHCQTEITPVFPGPAWRRNRDGVMPPDGWTGDVYFEDIRQWGRASWRVGGCLGWKFHDPQPPFGTRISHWYDERGFSPTQTGDGK